MRGSPARIGIRCDAGRGIGVGHLVRCVALAEELLSRGVEVQFIGDTGGLPFVERQLRSRGLASLAAPESAQGHVDLARDNQLDVVVVDSYTLPPQVTSALMAAGFPVVAIVDGGLRGQSAHLFVDQNIGAEDDVVDLPAGSLRLAGTAFALLRDAVRELRPHMPWAPRRTLTTVVVAFGGTDTAGITEGTVRALAAADETFAGHVVTADDAVRARLSQLRLPPGSSLTTTPPFDEFPRVLAGADLVLGAAGTSAWEYCCLGVPAAVAAVVDNQVQTYQRLVAGGTALPLGDLTQRGQVGVDEDAVTSAVHDVARRQRAAESAHRLVDGNGRVRVADALLSLAGL